MTLQQEDVTMIQTLNWIFLKTNCEHITFIRVSFDLLFIAPGKEYPTAIALRQQILISLKGLIIGIHNNVVRDSV